MFLSDIAKFPCEGKAIKIFGNRANVRARSTDFARADETATLDLDDLSSRARKGVAYEKGARI